MEDCEVFLKELRDSADAQYKIFTEGSCFRLYKILKIIYPNAVAYWSDRDGHCVTKIDKSYYDIGGKLNSKYVDSQYYKIPKNQLKGYGLLKYTTEENKFDVSIEKYDTTNK